MLYLFKYILGIKPKPTVDCPCVKQNGKLCEDGGLCTNYLLGTNFPGIGPLESWCSKYKKRTHQKMV
jgi:hypothetical protein